MATNSVDFADAGAQPDLGLEPGNAPRPDNEGERLEALRRYGVLDTPPEADFDGLALLASQICRSPVALVTLIDADRQWIKARIGIELSEVPRDAAFCAQMLIAPELLIVPDTLADPRFSRDPLVAAGPKIRFYAGVPLVNDDGYTLGTLCVMDRAPRELAPEQMRGLRLLGREVMTQFEIRKIQSDLAALASENQAAAEALRASEEFKSKLIACSRDCIKVLDLEGRLVFMNTGGMEVLEICDLGPVLNTPWVDFWQGDDRQNARDAVATARTGGVGRFTGYFPTTMTGKPRWWDVVVSPIRDANGQTERLLALSRDVTEQHLAEETFRAIVVATASTTGGDFFPSLVRHMAAALQVRYAFVTECDNRKHARALAFWKGDGFGDSFEFDIADTPCMKVLNGEVCHYKEGIQSLFPKDTVLAEWKADSYLGVPMTDASDRVIGHIAVLDDKPMPRNPRAIDLVKIFAARAAAELKRQRAEAELKHALEQVQGLQRKLEAENVYLREEIRSEHNFDEMVGSSPALMELLSKIERVAPTDSTVLIHGETGTGKELIARALHSRSRRKDHPLVKVNCGAIPAGLVESELFGHVKGAFTGALERRTGRFELANGGTLFLDEVGELPLDTQVKLLRVLQEQEFEPVGSGRTVKVDVRIIAASNRDLQQEVNAGRFRSDLFYRLNVLPLTVPPLRDRRSDIPQLVLFFLGRFSKKCGKQVEGVSQETMDLLLGYPWPGNIRELQNVIERGVALCQGRLLHLGPDLLPSEASTATRTSSGAPSPAIGLSSLEEIEKRHILAVLQQTQGVIDGPKGAAKILGLHPNTLRSRMKRIGISRPHHEISQ
jgi:PAS domain S-box-containing protein